MGKEHITMIGAGLAGPVMASYLAELGYSIEIHEKRHDMRLVEQSAGRSINLALSKRGINALKDIGVFEKIKPDLVFVVADRFENLSVAVAASYMNIPLAHLQGGEVTGSIDESLRHSMSKFANYHLVANADAKKRLIKMGEYKKNIYAPLCLLLQYRVLS